MTRTRARNLALVAALTASLIGLAGCGESKGAVYADGKLSMAVIATYGTGTSTYADMAAVANALTNTEGINTRIITSDTAIGRLTPLRGGQATFARTGDEYIFAFRGEFDFATRQWGPQPMRVVWAPTAPHSFMVRADSAIVRPADLRGKAVPRITANPSVNNKTNALLAGAGLSWNDVRQVPISYSGQPNALKSGQLDVLFLQVYGSSLFELESSTPVRWLKLDDKDTGFVQRVGRAAPSVTLKPFTGAPGQKRGESDIGFQYAVPLVTYAKTDDEIVYTMARDLVDNFEAYKSATATSKGWSIDEAVIVPQEVPFHPGLIRLLEERHHWTPQAQTRQDQLLAQEEKLAEGWASLENTSDEDLPTAWEQWKAANLHD